MEGCCQLWNPSYIGEIEDLEGVQRSFTSKIIEVEDQNYWQRLKLLNLFSLQRRRERYCILYVWKILENLVPNDIGLKLSNNSTRGRSVYIEGPKTNRSSIKTLRANSFSRSGPKMFNCLPSDLKNMSGCTKETFKNKLDQFLRKIDDRPPIKGYPSIWPEYNKIENLVPKYLKENRGEYSCSSRC